MRNIIKLGMLAALATVSAHAVQVDFTTFTPYTNQASITVGNVTVTGYKFNEGAVSPASEWVATSVRASATGIGVVGSMSDQVEGTWYEYLLLDFGNTLTGTVQVDTLTLNFPSGNPGNSPYFRYSWLSSTPAGNPGNPQPASMTGWTAAPTGTGTPTATSFSFGPLASQGRYLLLGAVNGSFGTTNYFQLQNVDYTSVPDGASTLALMGAALATLGFAGRRRKA